MSGDFQTIREIVRSEEYLKANVLRLYKYRNALMEIQLWESTPEGQRQNYEAVNEKQKLIQNVQAEIDRRLHTFGKAMGKWVLGILAAVATVLGTFLYSQFFSPSIPQPQQKPSFNRDTKKARGQFIGQCNRNRQTK